MRIPVAAQRASMVAGFCAEVGFRAVMTCPVPMLVFRQDARRIAWDKAGE
jgi:hypothetical protein